MNGELLLQFIFFLIFLGFSLYLLTFSLYIDNALPLPKKKKCTLFLASIVPNTK